MLYVRPPLFRVDPTGRCGVMRAYDRKLIVVPFRGEFAVPDALGVVDDYRPLPPSYVLDTEKLGIHAVRDFVGFVFLSKFNFNSKFKIHNSKFDI